MLKFIRILGILFLYLDRFCIGNSYDQTVHIIPHTHNDAGWLRPVDEYYYGVDGLNEATGVKYILNSVYAELMFNQNFKFVYCEIVFFSKWWNEQNYTIQNNVKYLVKNERLRFVGGGWVMNDEAVTHYSDVIDQMTIGRLFIKNTFGIEAVPSIAWQIDPFGHSVSSILIFQMMNMNDLVHWRIPEKFEKKLNKNNVVDYDWKSKVSNYHLKTHHLQDSYTSKFQFDFERYAAIVDDKHSSSYNLDSIVEYFMLYSAKMLKNTKFNDVMIPIGGDFTYENAHKIFYNVEKMIYYANIESLKYNLNVTYVVSTPYDYIKSTKQNVLPVFYDDALPLVDYNVWTGFYTTRPDLKRKIRILSIVNNNVRSLYTQYIIQTKSRNKLQHLFDKIVETLALVQHHDAITGTSPKKTYQDYMNKLDSALKTTLSIYQFVISKYAIPNKKIQLNFCQHFIINQDSMVFIYNQQMKGTTQLIKIAIDDSLEYQIYDDNVSINYDINRSILKNEIVFSYNIKPLSGQNFLIISKLKKLDFIPYMKKSEKIKFHEICGQFSSSLYSKVCSDGYYIMSNIGYYIPNHSNHPSGHYTFNPENYTFHSIGTGSLVYINKNKFYKEIHIVYANWAQQVIRIFKEKSSEIEIEWIIGPIPLDNNVGKEIVVQYNAIIDNEYFYTSNNGLVTVQRKYNETEKYEANFYPITNSIHIHGKTDSITVLVDRPVGGTSPHKGQIDLLIHRSLASHDQLGIPEKLVDNSKIHTIHSIMFDKSINDIPLMNQNKLNEPVTQCMNGIQNFDTYENSTSYTNYSITNSNPESFKINKNVHLLTLQMLQEKILMRFQYNDGKIEKQESLFEWICPEIMFKGLKVKTMESMSLDAVTVNSDQIYSEYCVKIKPGEIKTLLITL